MKIFLFTTIFFVSLYTAFSQATITNGSFWNDTSGNRIEAHGAGVIKVGTTYYLIGEDKSHNDYRFKGVNLYKSSDLSNWQFIKTIIDKNTHPDLQVEGRVIERPKIIYNERDSRYVVWLHYESGNYGQAEAGVFYSMGNNIEGNYRMHKHFRPFNKMSRDCTLFKDTDGTAYFISAANENADIEIYRLTSDYLDVAANIVTLWPGNWREAPAVFKHNSTYFMVTSGATGWNPNQAKYAWATSMAGPWSELQDLGNATTYGSQPTYIIPVQGSKTASFIYCGDRWDGPNNLRSSKYIWLPLKINGRALDLHYYENWQINVETGEIVAQAIPNGRYEVRSVANNQNLASTSWSNWNAIDVYPQDYLDQRWEVTHLGNDVYSLKLACCNRYLDAASYGCLDGATIVSWEWNGGNNQKWKISSDGFNYTLKPLHCTSRALDVDLEQQEVVLWNFNEFNNNQQWQFLRSSNTGKSLAYSSEDNPPVVSQVTIFPNPIGADNNIYVTGNALYPNEEVKLNVMDIQGNKLIERLLQVDTNKQLQVHVGALKKGFYMIRLNSRNLDETLRFVK